jgi:hypothetical protein
MHGWLSGTTIFAKRAKLDSELDQIGATSRQAGPLGAMFVSRKSPVKTFPARY